MKGWKGIISTLLIIFVTAVIGAAVAAGLDVQGNWRAILIAGVSAVLTAVVNYLNPKDARYGIGAE